MDELVDFEELIDLNLSLTSASKESSQEPIADVLDKMCEAMGESNFTMNSIFKNNENEADEIVPEDDIVNLDAFENLLGTDDAVEINEQKNDKKVPDDDIVNLDAFKNLLATSPLCNNESNLVPDDALEKNEKKNDEKVPDDDIVNLDAVENLLGTSSLCNNKSNLVPDDALKINEQKNDKKKSGDDIVNLDAFEHLLATASLCNDESNLVTDDAVEINEKKNDEKVPDEDIVNLDAFENLLATSSLCNNESNLVPDDALEINEKKNDVKVPDDDIINLDAFENLLATASLRYDETDDMLEINEKNNDLIVTNDDVINLDEFDSLIGTAGLCNDEINSITQDISRIDENMVKMPDDAIDLDEFASISANACLFIDDEDTTDNSINRVSYAQRVLSYEVPVEFENDCAHTTERDVVKKQNVTSTNKDTVNTISLDFTSNVGEHCIDLNTFEFGTVNQIYNQLKTVKEYENKLETVTEECKMEINFTEAEDIVTPTINDDSQVKYENAVIPSETDPKYTIDAVTEDSQNKNTDSDDGYDSSDFEFISEQEASKAGIYTRISKMIINRTNNIDSTRASTFKNANSLSKHKRNTSGQSNSTSIDRPPKNEASLSDYVKYSKYRYQRCYSRPASEFHEIPEGERYLDMFRGEYAPEVVNNLFSLTNKRALSAVAMAANFEDLAYRDPGREDEINEKYKDDAEDCRQKIVSTYRYENRTKRRRH